MKTKQSFREWLNKVDAYIDNKCGLSHDDLPDICYRDMYDAGNSPASAGREALQNADF